MLWNPYQCSVQFPGKQLNEISASENTHTQSRSKTVNISYRYMSNNNYSFKDFCMHINWVAVEGTIAAHDHNIITDGPSAMIMLPGIVEAPYGCVRTWALSLSFQDGPNWCSIRAVKLPLVDISPIITGRYYGRERGGERGRYIIHNS